MEIKSCESNKATLESLKETKVFDAFYEILTFAACIGFEKKQKRKIDRTDKTIELYLFENYPNFHAVLYGIALAEERTQEVLQKTNEAQARRFKYFEEYANGGLDILKRSVVDAAGDPLENLLVFLKNEGSGYRGPEGVDGKPGGNFDFSFGLA